MRTTKVYSITMPPDLARQAEALAKKENRTMSELMREALRRYQQPQPMLLDVREYIRQIAPTPPAYQAVREDARRKALTSSPRNKSIRRSPPSGGSMSKNAGVAARNEGGNRHQRRGVRQPERPRPVSGHFGFGSQQGNSDVHFAARPDRV
jgi:Arc/MetJ-type ribon-helix-helix transcriptional regulator